MLKGDEKMNGHLVIAGGNVKNEIIYKKFIEYSGDAKIAIVPTASFDTKDTLKRFTQMFENLGIKRDKLIGIKVDPDKYDCNIWKKTGDDFDSLDFLDDVRGVWFTGGDQIKIIRSFLKNDGTETKILKKIKEILNKGGVIGGSSAGAAIMSEITIGGGNSFGALNLPYYENYVDYREKPYLEESGVLLITKGLGFFKHGIVDQHFDEKSRLGRLIETMLDKNINRGFGISEDTAIVYDDQTFDITVVGSGRVAVIDISCAEKTQLGNVIKISKLKLKYLKSGDDFSILNDFEDCNFYYADICFDISLEAIEVQNMIAAVK